MKTLSSPIRDAILLKCSRTTPATTTTNTMKTASQLSLMPIRIFTCMGLSQFRWSASLKNHVSQISPLTTHGKTGNRRSRPVKISCFTLKRWARSKLSSLIYTPTLLFTLLRVPSWKIARLKSSESASDSYVSPNLNLLLTFLLLYVGFVFLYCENLSAKTNLKQLCVVLIEMLND